MKVKNYLLAGALAFMLGSNLEYAINNYSIIGSVLAATTATGTGTEDGTGTDDGTGTVDEEDNGVKLVSGSTPRLVTEFVTDDYGNVHPTTYWVRKCNETPGNVPCKDESGAIDHYSISLTSK